MRATFHRNYNFAMHFQPTYSKTMGMMQYVGKPAEKPPLDYMTADLILQKLHREGIHPNPGPPDSLPDDERARLTHLAQALCWAQAKRDRLALPIWVEQVWLRLGGAHCLSDQELRHVECFFFRALSIISMTICDV